MKKIFTLMACLACVCWVRAQVLTFKHDGSPIEEGSVVYCSAYNEPIAQFGQLTYKPEITLSCSKDATICVEVKSTESDEKWGLCSLLPTGCINTLASTGYTAFKSGAIGTADVNLEIEYIHGKLAAGAIVTREALVSAWIEGKEEEKVSFILVVTNDDTLLGVAEVEVTDKVQLVGRNLVYAFGQCATRDLAVYGLDGQLILVQQLEGQQGQVSLSEFNKGVYVYQISGGAALLSRKVVLK